MIKIYASCHVHANELDMLTLAKTVLDIIVAVCYQNHVVFPRRPL